MPTETAHDVETTEPRPEPQVGGSHGVEPSALHGDIQLELQFALDKQLLSLRDLQSLSVGQCFRLHLNPFVPVQLMCCDELIGRGRLVSLEGGLAVQIAELTEHPAREQ